MCRFYFIITSILVIVQVARLVEATTRKPFPRCPAYKADVYEEGVPSCGGPESRQNLSIQSFPHIGIIRLKFDDGYLWTILCTLISPRYVLTDAFDLFRWDASNLMVRMGGTMAAGVDSNYESSDYNVSKIILHPSYNRTFPYKNDIGLLKFSRNVEYSANVRPICLPETDINFTDVYRIYYQHNESESDFLAKEKLEGCTKEIITPVTMIIPHQAFHGSFCAKPISIISDDDSDFAGGGPIFINQEVKLVSNFTQIACSHVQFGIVKDTYPDGTFIFTKIYPNIDWIESVIYAADGEDV